MDRGEAEPGRHQLLEPVHVARLHRGHPLLLEVRQLRAIRRRRSSRAEANRSSSRTRSSARAATRANDGTTSPWHTGHAAGSPVTRPSHTRDITSSSVGPARGARGLRRVVGTRRRSSATSSSPAHEPALRRRAAADAADSATAASSRSHVGHVLGRTRPPRALDRAARLDAARHARRGVVRPAPTRRGLRRSAARRSRAPRAPAPAACHAAGRARGGANASPPNSDSWPSSSSSARLRSAISVALCDLPQHSDDAAEHAHLARADRLHRLVLGLQAHVVGLLEEPLHRRLLPHQRDDDLAVLRRVLTREPRPSRPAGCRRSSSTRRGRAAGTRRPRHRRCPGSARSPRCSPRPAAAHPRPPGPAPGSRTACTADFTASTADVAGRRRPVQQLDRPRLRRVPPQQPDLLQVGQVRVHRRRRRQPHRLADVPHRGRIAMAARNSA